MEAVVHQPLRDVTLLDPLRLEPAQVEDHLVRDSAVLPRVEHVVVLLQPRLEIVGVEDGVARCVGHTGRAEHPDVAVRDQQDAGAPPRRRRDRWNRLLAADRGIGVPGQVRRQVGGHADRPHARTAAAVRDGVGLVQVQVAHVGADRRRAGQPDLRVHVGAVHVHLAAVLVHRGADVLDRILEDAVRRRVGDHQRRQPVAMLRRLGGQVGDVDVAMRVGGDDDDAIAGHDGAGRIGAVGRRGNEHHVAMPLAAVPMIGADHRQPGELALRPGVGLQRRRGEAGHRAQRALELAADLLVALGLFRRRERVHARELVPRHRVHLARGVELHRARAERNHRGIEADVLALEALHVAHHLGFRVVRVEHRVGQVRGRAPQRRRNHVARPVGQRGHRFGHVASGGGGEHADDRLYVLDRRGLVERDADRPVQVAEVEPGLGGGRADGGQRRARRGDAQGVEEGVVVLPVAGAAQRDVERPRQVVHARRDGAEARAARGRPRTSPPCWRAAPARCRCSTSPSRAGCAVRASAATSGRRACRGRRPRRR